MPALRDQVFISYCHKDREWLSKLQTMLKPMVRNKIISVWEDTKISAGDEWRGEIKEALARAKAAVLLVSPYFLESDFIAEHELPPLLDAAKKEGLVILWVYISHCLYDETEIERYQAANEISKPLDSLTPSEQNRVLADVCRKIKAAATPKTLPQTQAEHDALASAISRYNRPPSGPLSSGPALGPDAQEILELMEQEPDSKMRILAERIFPPEHNRSTSTRTYEYRVR
jgi:TIR domain